MDADVPGSLDRWSCDPREGAIRRNYGWGRSRVLQLASEANERLTGTHAVRGSPLRDQSTCRFRVGVVVQYRTNNLRKNFVDLVKFHLFHPFSLFLLWPFRNGVRFRGCRRPAAVLHCQSLARRRPKGWFGNRWCDLGSTCRHTDI